jgi:hypothetical protein
MASNSLNFDNRVFLQNIFHKFVKISSSPQRCWRVLIFARSFGVLHRLKLCAVFLTSKVTLPEGNSLQTGSKKSTARFSMGENRIIRLFAINIKKLRGGIDEMAEIAIGTSPFCAVRHF